MVKEIQIDVESKQLALMKKILKRHIAYKTVWTYGSRVNWTANQYSDLDLVVFDVNTMKLGELKEDFTECDLPFSVDIVLWEKIPENFKNKIRKKYVVLQKKPELEDWKECKVGDMVTLNYGKSLPLEKRKNGDIPVYSSAGLTGWHDKALVDSRGLIIGRKGTIGKVYKSEAPFYVIDTAYYVLPNEEVYDFDFLFFLLSSIGLDDLNEDSAVPGLNRDTAYSLPVLLPPLPEQKAIASVLSSLDDKIDLLHRQNKTLEAMAETLFRQLFVEEAKDGWKEVKLDSLINISSGKGLKKDLLIENGIYPVLGANGEIGRTNEFLFDEKLLFTGRVGTLGNIFRVENEKVWLSDNTLVIKPKNHFNFIYFVLKAAKFEEYNVGSTQPLIRQSDIKEITISLPSETKLHEFEKKLDLLFQKMKHNMTQIHTLDKLRDTLLPKLMSGEVRVQFEEN